MGTELELSNSMIQNMKIERYSSNFIIKLSAMTVILIVCNDRNFICPVCIC